jgi:hypothetical protein
MLGTSPPRPRHRLSSRGWPRDLFHARHISTSPATPTVIPRLAEGSLPCSAHPHPTPSTSLISLDKVGTRSYYLRRLTVRGVAQPGSALASGARGRWFNSSRPDHTEGSGNAAFCAWGDPSLFPQLFLECPNFDTLRAQNSLLKLPVPLHYSVWATVRVTSIPAPAK